MTQAIQQKVADVAVPMGWGALAFSHLAELNQILQFILLVTSIIATLIAIRYHLRNTPK